MRKIMSFRGQYKMIGREMCQKIGVFAGNRK
jgi:hypothetical protein